ncbi:DUF3017 domain-containing protein [Streptomyces buecherae]|uniref:DUF3017 domain-containing protein n=1 Tax=Streptomyces buecherae TaxID=2763006 RepID=UPI0033FD636D
MSAHASGEGGLAAAAAGAAAQHGPRPGTRVQRHSGPGRGSRRFPRITRDTARPEGGGRAASGQAPAPARQWPLLTVMSGVAAGLLVVALDAHRAGTLVIGFSLLLGALLRWLLPSVGMLAVRSRFTDMVTYGLLGSLIVVLSMMTQPNPWLEIPFLEDLMEFTVR